MINKNMLVKYNRYNKFALKLIHVKPQITVVRGQRLTQVGAYTKEAKAKTCFLLAFTN